MVCDIIMIDLIKQCSLILPKYGYSDFRVFLKLMRDYIKMENYIPVDKLITKIINNISTYMDITYGIEKQNLYDIVLELLTIEI